MSHKSTKKVNLTNEQIIQLMELSIIRSNLIEALYRQLFIKIAYKWEHILESACTVNI